MLSQKTPSLCDRIAGPALIRTTTLGKVASTYPITLSRASGVVCCNICRFLISQKQQSVNFCKTYSCLYILTRTIFCQVALVGCAISQSRSNDSRSNDARYTHKLCLSLQRGKQPTSHRKVERPRWVIQIGFVYAPLKLRAEKVKHNFFLIVRTLCQHHSLLVYRINLCNSRSQLTCQVDSLQLLSS